MKPEDNLIISLTGSGTVPESIVDFDWGYILRIGRRNRLDGLIFDALDRRGLFVKLPTSIRKGFEENYRRTVLSIRSSLAMADSLARTFSSRGIDLLVLRGTALGLTVYPRPFLRPCNDLDIIVSREAVPEAKKLLRAGGFEQRPGLLPDRYFEKYHLHIPFIDKKTGFPVELHWALDHPFTLYMIDYPELFQSKMEISYEGRTIPVLCPEHRLLGLALHFFKHCPFLPDLLDEEDFVSLLLQGGWVLWLLDIRLTLMQAGAEFDRGALLLKARRWNLENEVRVCLEAVEYLYRPSPLPTRESPSRKLKSGFLRKKAYAQQLLLLRKAGRPGPITRFLFGLRPNTIFRPVRILDSIRFLFPGSEYLRKRYHPKSGWFCITSVLHTIRAMRRLLANLTDYLYYRFRQRR